MTVGKFISELRKQGVLIRSSKKDKNGNWVYTFDISKAKNEKETKQFLEKCSIKWM